MRVTIDHIAVMCADLERSLHFYRDLLGFEVVSPEEHDGGPIDQMVRIDGVYGRPAASTATRATSRPPARSPST